MPEDLHCFSSLEILDLSCNDFVKLPDSLNHLKKLKTLNLNYCTKLKDLPLFPPSLQRVQGIDCRSISEKFFNKILLVRSISEYHILFYFLIPSKSMKVECTIDEFQHSVSIRRLYEVNISDGRLYFFSRSNVDIMECFDQINEGDWVNIEFNDVSNVCGVFLSANIEYPQTPDHFVVGKLSVMFEIDGKPSNSSGIPMEYEFSSNRCVCVTYLPVTLLKVDLIGKSCCSIKATISCYNKYVKVKACGASILSWQSASEYLAKLFPKAYGSTYNFRRIIVEPNHKSECKGDDELEVENGDFPSSKFESGESGSTSYQRKNLKSVLGRIFEEARHYSARYFFPQANGFGWFKNQNKNNKVAVKLPLNIYKDKKWMGLAMFAMLSVSENAEYLSFDFEIHSDMWSQFNRKFFIPMSVLGYSNRILFIVFEPRNWYPYHLSSSSNHYLYISFNSNVERVQVELCGARLVYKQNVEGLVQTIMDCMEEAGADLNEYYKQENMKYLLQSIQSQNHHESIQYQNHHDSSLQDGSANNQTTALSCVDSSFLVEQLLLRSFQRPFLQTSVEVI